MLRHRNAQAVRETHRQLGRTCEGEDRYGVDIGVLAVDLDSTFLLSMEALRRMDQGWGRVVNIGSLAGRNGVPTARRRTGCRRRACSASRVAWRSRS